MARQLTVLLVASDGLTRQITANGLAMYGYETVLARDGMEAMTAITAGDRIDILVVDADLTGEMPGLEVAKAARLRHPRCDVIYTSRMPFRIPEAQKVKGAPSIRTPYQPQQIVGMISELRHRGSSEERNVA